MLSLFAVLMLAQTGHAHDRAGERPQRCPANGQAVAGPDVSYGAYKLMLPGRALITVLADCGTLRGANLEVAEVTLMPRKGGVAVTPNHTHPGYELFYVLSGTLRYGVADRVYEVRPGGLAIIRPGVRIFHDAIGGKPVKLLAIWSPAGALEDLKDRFGFVPVSDFPTSVEGNKK
nr:cupin domain-containing protein [Kordiimonas marina]